MIHKFKLFLIFCLISGCNTVTGTVEGTGRGIVKDTKTIRSAAGVGIDWFTPVGPLSFSFSQPITKDSGDKTEGFRFNLGTTF